jgi:hypothetical protein
MGDVKRKIDWQVTFDRETFLKPCPLERLVAAGKYKA